MARRMRTSSEIYAKEVLGTALEFRGQVITEYEIVERRQRAETGRLLLTGAPGARAQ
jgi:hypothetical protein